MRALCDPATILTGHAVGAISLQLHEGKRKRQRRVTAGARWHARGACPIRLHRLNFSRTGFSPETVIPHCGVKFFFAEIAELVQKFRDELWKWKSRQIQSENVIMSSLKVFGYFVEPCRHSDRPCSLLNFPTTSWAERVKVKMRHRQSQRTFLRHFSDKTGFLLFVTYRAEDLTQRRWFLMALSPFPKSYIVQPAKPLSFKQPSWQGNSLPLAFNFMKGKGKGREAVMGQFPKANLLGGVRSERTKVVTQDLDGAWLCHTKDDPDDPFWSVWQVHLVH